MGQSEADAQAMVDAEVIAGDDEDAQLVAQALDELGRVQFQVVAREGNRGCIARKDSELAILALGPLLQDGIAASDEAASALEDLRAHLG